MLEKLPNNDLFILDAISTWYDEHGEEKAMPYDSGKMAVEKYCYKRSLKMIDKQRYDQSMDELEHYAFLEVLKPTKKRDGKKKSFTLRVDLDELISELQKHPALYNDENPK